MALSLDVTSPFWRPWNTGQEYARRVLDAFPKTSNLPIATMPPYSTRRRPRRRRIVRRRAMRLKRGGRRLRYTRKRTRTRARKPPVVVKTRIANRGFGSALAKARNAFNYKYVYDQFKLSPVSMSTTGDTIKYFNVRVSDFPQVSAFLTENSGSGLPQYFTEYKLAGMFVKITPRNANYKRNSVNFAISDGYTPFIAAYPLTHFGVEPVDPPSIGQLRSSNGVKWIPMDKGRSTHLPVSAFFEEIIKVNDEGDMENLGEIKRSLMKMPWMEFNNTVASNPKFAPFAIWLPKAADANSILNYSISYHAVFALRNNRTDVTE